MFYGNSVGNVIILLIACFFISMAMDKSGVSSLTIVFWNGITLAAVFGVFVIEFAFKKITLNKFNVSFWLWLRMGFGALITFSFGIVVFLLQPSVSIEYEMYILIILVTISSLTISTYAIMLKYSFMVLATTLLPFTIYMFTKTGFFYSNLAFTVLIIQVVLLIKAVQVSKSAVAVLYLQENLISEIKGHKETKQHLDYLVNHDVLTGLPNRYYLIKTLGKLLDEAKNNNSFISVLYIDLDGFKLVNDNYGHAAGDELLVEVASRLRTQESNQHIVARLGGDEFVIIIHDANATEAIAMQVKFEVIQLLTKEYLIGNKLYNNIGASIGISNLKGQSYTADSLLKEADIAMYQVKKNRL